MMRSLPPHWRRLFLSLAYGVFVIAVVGLGYLTLRVSYKHRHASEEPNLATVESTTTPLIDIASFTARREKSIDVERLTISLRLRLASGSSADCFVYVLARNDHVSPRLWGVWPAQAAGGAVTAAGNFRGGNPTFGERVGLTSSWTRIVATINHPPDRPPFETATVYVVSSTGEVLVARPFVL
jgi:hypothetical protein